MTDIYNPDDTSGSPVAAIVRVADRTPDDEATVDVIYSDPQMISKNNLDVLVKTYIGAAQLNKDEDAGAAFAITAVPANKAKLETLYIACDGTTQALTSSDAHGEPPGQTGDNIPCVTYSMVPVSDDALELLRESVIARADQIRLAADID